MNFGELTHMTRVVAQDTSTYSNLWTDEEIRQLLNEAQVEACRRSPHILRSTSPTLGETRSKCEMTVLGISGTITSILIDSVNIINNPVSYTSNDINTAALLANEINDTGLFEATPNGNIITLTSPEGSGARYNNCSPIINSTNTFVTTTTLSGGVDGICVINYKPNKREYKFSNKLLKIESAYADDVQKKLAFKDFSGLSSVDKQICNQKGDVDYILYGMSNDSFYLAKIPNKKGYINMTVCYMPLKLMKNNNDVPEIPEQYHSKLIHYALYKMYMKNDIEGGQMDISSFHYSKFIEEFGDSQMSAASNKNNQLFFFGD